ncbi:PAS domain S-box protein [Methanoculleus frigidifontis]|uniref:PAS domain S-box protein n=1 Tax=Methanoculleus frigidifontis TaxID=2584085 RepID=UPI00265A0B40|nr:PAS domain S-box protein [Methanoculleus sp. FWC-SCC1]
MNFEGAGRAMPSPMHAPGAPVLGQTAAAFWILDELEDGILIVARDGRIAWANAACEAFFGIAPGSARDLDLAAFMHRFVLPLVPDKGFGARIVPALAGGSEVPCCRFRVCRNGFPDEWLSVSSRKMEDERFRGSRMLRFQAVTEPEPAVGPVMHLAEDGEILSANGAAAPLLAHWNVLVGDRLPESWIPMLRAVLGSGAAERIDLATEACVYALTFAPVSGGRIIAVSGTGISPAGEGSRPPGDEYRYRELFNSMKSGAAVYEAREGGQTFVFKDFNLAAERMDGIPRAEVLGKTLTEVYPGAESFGITDALRRVWETGEAEVLPVQLYRDDRLVRWRDNYIYRLPSGELVAVFDDMTAQHRAENTLKERERMFREIAQRSFDIIFTLDAAGTITYVSPAVRRVLGYEPSAAIGMAGRDYITPQHHDRYAAAAERLRAGRDVEGLIFELTRRDGSTAYVEVNASPITSDGSVTGIQGVGRDITDRVRMEQEKKQAYDRISRNIEQFAVVGDHVRQPLQVLLGVADLVEDAWGGMIVEQVERINSIINELDQGWIESRKVREFLKRYD